MRIACIHAVLLALAGCERTFRDMYDQPREKPLAASAQWPDGRASRTSVPGTVPHVPQERPATAGPTAVSLARGRERFDIFCAPCHSLVGDGDGMIARRGFPHPPSFHTDALRAASDAHIYSVISNGYGAMYSYASRIPPADRMAIVAYIRALQLSQHATLDAVPADARRSLEGEPR
jgi:mono/diheme cytochrome c family protein